MNAPATMQPEASIRAGVPADAENLAALGMQVWLHTYATDGISSTISQYVLSTFTADKFLALLAYPSTAVLVAEAGKNLVGYALVTFDAACPAAAAATSELATLYVQEHFAGRGIGSLLLARAEAQAREQTGTPLWLTVNARNSRAIAFYQRRGYTKIGITQFRLGADDHENHVLVGRNT